MVVHVQSLPEPLRRRVIVHDTFHAALDAAESSDPAWLRIRASVLRAGAVCGMGRVAPTNRVCRERPASERRRGSGQARRIALDALASACGASVLERPASLLSAGSDVVVDCALLRYGPATGRRSAALARIRLLEPTPSTSAVAFASALTATPPRTQRPNS